MRQNHVALRYVASSATFSLRRSSAFFFVFFTYFFCSISSLSLVFFLVSRARAIDFLLMYEHIRKRKADTQIPAIYLIPFYDCDSLFPANAFFSLSIYSSTLFSHFSPFNGQHSWRHYLEMFEHAIKRDLINAENCL